MNHDEDPEKGKMLWFGICLTFCVGRRLWGICSGLGRARKKDEKCLRLGKKKEKQIMKARKTMSNVRWKSS